MSKEDDNLSQDSDEYRIWKAGAKAEDVVHLCPRGCKGTLVEQEGILLMCNECDGFKCSVEKLTEGSQGFLEKMYGEHVVKDIISNFIRNGKEGELICPLCNKKMNEIELEYDSNHIGSFQPITRGALRGADQAHFLTDHPIFLLFGVILLSVEAVNVTGHLAKKTVAAVKTKNIKTITLDGCASCESMWFDGEKYSCPTSSYNHEIVIFERFWESIEKSDTINRLDEEKEEARKKEKEVRKKEVRRKEARKKEARKKERARRAALTPEQRQAEFDNRPYWQRYNDLEWKHKKDLKWKHKKKKNE